MLIQPLREPAPLALRGPEIPGRTEPVLDTGEWGINLAAAKGNFPLQGLKIHILPWSNMGKGDKAVLLFDGAQVDQHTINDDIEVGERVTVWVNPRHLTNGSHTLSYSVIRFNQAAESYTPPVKLFVKLELPGGQDLNPEAGEHSELYLYIDPALIADGVDKDSAAAGVAVTIKAKPGSISRLPYPNIAPRDVITLSWGGRRIRSAPVTQEQIDDPDAHPIVVQVTEADILQAGDSGPHGLAVTFTIHDLVNNAAEDWCTETRIVVDTGSSRLEAPLVEQANGNELDLDALGDDDLHLMVWAATDDFNLHDVVIMHIKGTTLEGEAIDVTVRQTIEKSPPRLVDVYLPNSAGRALGQTQAIFFYQLERGGSIIQRSKGRFINIIGDPVRLLAPIAEDAQNGALDPDLSEVRIRIPYDERIKEGMGIELKWLAIRADLTTYEPDLGYYIPSANEANDPAGFVITVEGKHLKTAEGGTLDLSYNLLEEKDGEIISRASQHAALLNVGAPQFELVAPSVLGEADGMLEPNDLVNGLSKVTCPAPVANPTLPNDVVTWQLRDANGTLLFEDRKTLNALTAGRDVTFSLDADFVQEHFEGNRSKPLTVSYNILRANTGKVSYSNPLVFTVGAALALTPPRILQAESDGKTLQPINAVDALTAVIDAQDLQLSDQLSVKWQAPAGTPAGGSHTTPARPISETTLNVALPVSVLAFCLGKTVTLTYLITRDGKTTESLPLTLSIGVLPVASLNSPILTDAVDGVLDVTKLGANAVIRARDWPFIAINQHVWMRLSGKKADGTEHKLDIWSGGASFVNSTWFAQKYWPRNVAKSFFTELADNSPLTLSFKAALDQSDIEANAVVFADQVYTVKAFEVVAPTITEAKDSKGVVIPQGGITVDTSVTLTGTASKGQSIKILDGTTDKGDAIADPATGIWTKILTGLSLAAHSLTAKALYGAGESSTARTFTVTETVAPRITSVKGSPSGEEIPDGGTTSETAITLTGVASKGQQVEVLNGTVSKGIATADPLSGTWRFSINDLSEGTYTLKAKALYGSGEFSALRRFNVIADLVRDFTDFVNKNWNGWTEGEGVGPDDLRIRNFGNEWTLVNITVAHKSGVIIQKPFRNLRPNTTYRYTIKTNRLNQGAVPRLSLRVSGITIAGPRDISGGLIVLTGTFVADGNQATLDIYSHVANGDGNDYQIHDIEVVRA